MPGIDVSANGQISYNGKPINKFYIENLDMLGGRYGIATNNVQAKDIAKVQVYEDHQPIKALQGIQHSDNAAINLTLKDEAKGTFNAVLQLGGGYKPLMWNSELIAMYFARKFQTMNTYKTNNSGDDVSQEFISHTDDSQEFYNLPLLNVSTPTTPGVAQNRYLNNSSHTFSFNSINRISEDIDIKANALYIHNKQKSFGNSQTSYHLPDGVLTVPENIYARQTTDKVEISGEYLANTKSALIKNKLQINGMWNKDFGIVQTDSEDVSQHFKNPQMSVANTFTFLNVYKNMRLSIVSQNYYTKSSANLNVTPLLHSDIYDNNLNFIGSAQNFNTSNFKSQTSAFTEKQFGKLDFRISAGYNLQIEKMTSALAPFDNMQTSHASADSLHNHIQWNQFRIFAYPSIRFSPRNLFNIDISVPLSYLIQSANDKIVDTQNKRNKFLIESSLQISYKMNVNTSVSAGASILNSNGSLYDTYSGYIMNNYRIIANNAGLFSDATSQNYNVSLSYGNAIKSLFGSLSAVYYNNKNAVMQNINYVGELQQISAYKMDNTYNGYILSGKMSKRYDNISSTFGLFAIYRKSFSDLLRQDVLIKYVSDNITIGATASVRLGKYGSFDYNVSARKSMAKIKNSRDKFSPIQNLTQDATLNLFITKVFTVSVAGEHFYNSAISDGSRSMFFTDAYFSYKTKRIDYIFEARNLTNEKTYKSASYSDISDYVYSYELRPISFLFKIRFSLK